MSNKLCPCLKTDTGSKQLLWYVQIQYSTVWYAHSGKNNNKRLMSESAFIPQCKAQGK